ncbi:MAG TPA: pirin family protein [Bacteroidia bacterium]|nr:pirin family protein [Bacteroidia bacterium]
MKTIFHPSNERGHANHGWLDAHHSFSFANWYDPSKVHFGLLRVLNDDIVAGGQGFGMHPHNDMEIITIILEGALEHRDNMGNGSVIRPGDVQVMSAGTGVFHSEFNPSKTDRTNLFQLWIFPKENGIAPRYDQKTFDVKDRENSIQTVASGFKKNGELYIHQDAALSLSKLDTGKSLHYAMNKSGNGAYVMVIDGKIKIGDQELSRRDALGISETPDFTMTALAPSELLIVEVPMQ